MRQLIVVIVLVWAGGANAAAISYQSQTRFVSVNTLDCPGFGNSASAADFALFDRTVANPGGEFLQFCADRVSAAQTSVLGDQSLAVELNAYSGTADLSGGGPAQAGFDVTFSLSATTSLRFTGTRFGESALGPNVVASENSAVLESVSAGPLALAWSDASCQEILNGGRCTETLDVLLRLGPGDYRLALTTLAQVDGTSIEFGAYRRVGTELLVTSVIPVPAAFWLFVSALAGLLGLRRR